MESIVEAPVRKMGLLDKLGGGAGGHRNWKARWTVLSDHLYYYESQAVSRQRAGRREAEGAEGEEMGCADCLQAPEARFRPLCCAPCALAHMGMRRDAEEEAFVVCLGGGGTLPSSGSHHNGLTSLLTPFFTCAC